MLNKVELSHILTEWNFWDHPPDPSIPRKALREIKGLERDFILVIQGVRRCGKSTLLIQIMSHLGLNPQDCTFVNFEDPRLSDHLNHHLLEEIVDFAKERRPEAQRRYFFFDEIQNVSLWQKWFHAKMERPSENFFVITGSNAALLSGDLASTLTGRHLTLELFPFDFEEASLAKPGLTLPEHLRLGGFPRAQSYGQPETLLREYFTDIIERDVRRHVSARTTLPLMQLAKMVFESMGSETSQRTLANRLGISADTVGSYLEACELAYMVLPCPYFTFSERQRLARNKKYYPVDLGLRNAVVTKTGMDQGKSLEALVFLALRKKYPQVSYWRVNGEVDFVVTGPDGITPYQVSWAEKKARHESALTEFYDAFPQANPCIEVDEKNFVQLLT